MAASQQKTERIESVADHLVTYAFEKEGLGEVLARIPEMAPKDRVGLEYEIQLLKIVTVGWGISFFMEKRGEKGPLVQTFWNQVQAFSRNLDSVTSLMTGARIDYFEVIRQRLDTYLEALRRHAGPDDPAAVFGPAYAECCGQAENVHVIMAGNRVFTGALRAVGEYLAQMTFDIP